MKNRWDCNNLLLAACMLMMTAAGCSESESAARCGNGVREAGEDCDKDDLGGRTCESLGLFGGVLACTDDCVLDASGCTMPDCGNGIKEGNEECDADDLGMESCETRGFSGGELGCRTCRFDTSLCYTCGDGVKETGEACDKEDFGETTCLILGYTSGSPGCLDDCSIDESGCGTCGNDAVDGDEECDGDEPAGMTCGDLGFDGGILRCSSSCTFNTMRCFTCGNDLCEVGENAQTCASDCGVVSLAAGRWHACAALRDGSVRCWGAHQGHRAGGIGDVTRPVPVTGLSDVRWIAAGEEHTCVLTSSNDVLCWGRNGFGQVGNGTVGYEVWPPETVESASGAIRLEAGRFHNCVLRNDELQCWGRGDFGQVGDFLLRNPAIDEWVGFGCAGGEIGSGGVISCCKSNSGGVACRGSNEHGQIGRNAHSFGERYPAAIPGLADALSIVVGGYHACALRGVMGNMKVVCWGANGSGQLGDGTLGGSRDVPVEVAGLNAGLFIGAGYRHSCAFVFGNSLACWGKNDYGQLGDGTRDRSPLPVAVLNPDGQLLQYTQHLALGDDFTCTIMNDATVRCWGRNDRGQLGDGTTTDRLHPVEPAGL